MRESGGVLSVSLSNVAIDDSSAFKDIPPGRYVKLSVSDTGHGIRHEIMDRIFDPFFTTKGPGEGTGLGLSVVYGAVGGHEGAISVASEPGHGATFDVYLPLYQDMKQDLCNAYKCLSD
jgi:signal transduction histidine kinase